MNNIFRILIVSLISVAFMQSCSGGSGNANDAGGADDVRTVTEKQEEKVEVNGADGDSQTDVEGDEEEGVVRVAEDGLSYI
jgi:hypothetical protein